MNKFKIAVIVALIGLASPVHAALSERCHYILADSALTFASIDAMKDGYTPDSPPDEETSKGYIAIEAEAMVRIYLEGGKTVAKGATRQQAQDFIRSSNSQADRNLPSDVQQMASDAAEAAFMCGYDDQTQDM